MIRALLASLLMLPACASPAVLPEVTPEAGAQLWTLERGRAPLLEASCPKGSRAIVPQPISVSAEPIELGGALDGLIYVGGWHLTSDDARFGGLSGLELLPSGDLLTVSDAGSFVQIGMTGNSPNGKGSLAMMRGAGGQLLGGKIDQDAEGLAVAGDLALVSFERDHRILGFAYEACGAGARGVQLAELPGELAGDPIGPNKGAEALSLSADGTITFGYEIAPGGGAPLGTVYGDGRARLTRDADAPRGYAQVGRDEAGGVVAELFRSYDPLRGNRNVIRIGALEARITRPMAADNYEGIALQELPSGKARVWIISDDNYNPKQRTLLLAFDLAG